MKRVIPFLVALCGTVSDYITTKMGLSLGFYETHTQYHPVLALLIFWGAITLLTATLPKKRFWHLSVNGLASASYLGAINNILVILGIFSGLKI
ncbi:hypothetical protein KAS14_03315 [Candidatus Bathyarchaeota archaeon]|nr:hypothetical protein [Candidatus Bathyarchaeota archaeon]